jgi:hypothetical protein
MGIETLLTAAPAAAQQGRDQLNLGAFVRLSLVLLRSLALVFAKPEAVRGRSVILRSALINKPLR